ncbi:hypothetical protein BJ875DRAFT_209111 [Amylocarpus encephaloides]|uniref:Ubiquitin-like protease family profile domain-containing protein n=1 Tax=Amylocarpus encephaloides TaxID=45428 RepID=A0A9P7YNF8_9HELO|nr:hypothetical protein BJ875DRAFT_209111 [Amylocarpus encephaloides]
MRNRYNDGKPGAVFPEFCAKLVAPISPASKTAAKNKKSMRKGLKGGVKPTNTLKRNHLNQNANARKDRHTSGGKPFDLKSESARSQAHPPKKQCVDGVRSGGASSTAPIDLESESSHFSRCRDDSTSRSLYESRQGSPSKNKQSPSKIVSEFCNVESTVMIGQKPKATVNNRYIQPRPGANKRTAEVLEREDTEDPIDDSVIITGPRPATCRDFPPPQSIINGRNSSSTNKATIPKLHLFQVTSGTQPTAKSPLTATKPDWDAAEEYTKHMQQQKVREDKRMAKDLFPKQKSNTKKPAAAQDSEALGEITDGEELRKEADMIHTKIRKSRQFLPKPPRVTRFAVKQFFGVPGGSLTSNGGETWQLLHDTEHFTLKILDAGRQQLLVVSTKLFKTLHYSNESAKLVIGGPITPEFKQGLKVYMELATSEDCRELRSELKKGDQTIGESHRDVEYLDKMFTVNSKKKFKPKQKAKSVDQNIPEDIKLAETNVRRRQQESWVEKQNSKPSSNAFPQTHTSKGSGPQKAQGLAKKMGGNYGVEESLPRPTEPQTTEPQSFYHPKTKASLDDAPAHATRTSSRFAEKDIVPQATRQVRSPSPLRWTDLNPYWTRDWKNESISYPQDRKAERRATVDKGDIRRLDDGEFLNDSLISFYLRYLENSLQQRNPDLAERVYFQNSHFYESLKGKGGSINYAKVQRWTRKVDLFSKDYIVVPVNENYHWYVAIICNAPLLLGNVPGGVNSGDVTIEEVKVLTQDDLKLSSLASGITSKGVEGDSESRRSSREGSDKACNEDSSSWPFGNPENERVGSPHNNINTSNAGQKAGYSAEYLASSPVVDKPLAEQAVAGGSKKSTFPRKGESLKDRARIIILDSLSGTHPNTIANLKSYLVEEMKDKKKMDISTLGIKAMNARNLPTQNNHYDCGPYLLRYVEKFLEKPDEFMSEVFHNQNDLSIEWRNATEMRNHIRDLLFKLQEDLSPPQKLKKKEKHGGEAAVKGTSEPLASSAQHASSHGTGLLKAEETKGAIVESNTANGVPLFKEPVSSSARTCGEKIEQNLSPIEIYETPVGEGKTAPSTRTTSGSTPGSSSKLPNYRNRNRSPTPYPRHQQSSPDILTTAQASELTRHDQEATPEPTSEAILIEPILNGSAATQAADGNDDETLLPTERQRTRQLSSSASITSSEHFILLG